MDTEQAEAELEMIFENLPNTLHLTKTQVRNELFPEENLAKAVHTGLAVLLARLEDETEMTLYDKLDTFYMSVHAYYSALKKRQ